MKIVYLGHKRIPSNEGGVERVVMEHVKRLARRGHHVWVLNRMGSDCNATRYNKLQHSDYHDCKIVNIPTLKGAAEVPIYSFLATIWCIFKRPDVVVYNSSGSCVMIPLARFFGLKTIGLLHGVDSNRGKWGRFASWYLRLGERMLAQKASVGMVLSRNMKKYIDTLYGSSTLLFANAAVERKKQAPEIIRNTLTLEKDSYILSLGRIVPEKGLHYLIDAFKQVKTDKRLIIAGGPDDKTLGYYREIQELAKGDKRIEFVGFVEGQLKEELYTNCYLFCLPSDIEGMANTLLESMAYGRCVLCSNIPENTEVVTDKAICHRQSDIKDIKEKLQMLCDSPTTVAQYAKESEPYILQRYNWEKVVDQMEHVFKGDTIGYYDMEQLTNNR